MTVQKTKNKVFIVDASKEIIKEVFIDKVPKYARQFRTKNDALTYLLFIQLEQYREFYTNSNLTKQLDKLQLIINDIRGQL
jgi:hypothetical protein